MSWAVRSYCDDFARTPRGVLGADDVTRLEEQIAAEASLRELLPALDQLAAGERAVLGLVALDGLSVTDAARALGIRPVAARVRLHRARGTIRSHLVPAAVTVADHPTASEVSR
jgi:RNA polymerase sigma-70 factor (ECF subfamily)